MRRPAAGRCGLALGLALLAAAASGSEAGLRAPAFDAGRALAQSQAVIGRRLSDHVVTDESGRPVRLSTLRGRPLVISPVYTSCWQVCPTTTAFLAGVVDLARQLVGESGFTVLTIGFDAANDTPERMADYARARGLNDAPQWIFASADPATLGRLLAEIGFTYASSSGGFDHMVQATVVDADGFVYRQVYGQTFDSPQLVDPLKRLVLGQRIADKSLPSLVDTVRLICSVYDPRTGRYRFDYSLVLSIAIGVLCFTAVAVFIWRSWRRQPARERPA
jgi:protein SCO1/2